jgi:hypothetical protein
MGDCWIDSHHHLCLRLLTRGPSHHYLDGGGRSYDFVHLMGALVEDQLLSSFGLLTWFEQLHEIIPGSLDPSHVIGSTCSKASNVDWLGRHEAASYTCCTYPTTPSRKLLRTPWVRGLKQSSSYRGIEEAMELPRVGEAEYLHLTGCRPMWRLS